MAYSGTISQTVFDTRKVIDNAFRRCKIPAAMISSEHIDIANDQLYLLLSALANDGAPLWCIEKVLMPLYEGTGDVTMPVGTVDILNGNLRTLQEVSGTDVTTSTTVTTTLDSETAVSTVGVLWSAASVPLALERSTDGSTWTTIQTETPSAVSGEWTWFDLTSSVATLYFRIRATSGTLSATQTYLGNNPTEIPLARLNRDDYTNLPNKVFQSNRPLQYWFDRQVSQPVMHLWPVPNSAATVYQLVLWRHRHIMDVGTMAQSLEVPQRWLDAIVASLAAKLSIEIPEVAAEMIPLLSQLAAAAMNSAQTEERDNSPIRWAPNVSMYTA